MRLISLFKHYWGFFAVFFFILLWTLLLTFISADEIVAYIGIENGYILGFAIAAIAGVSAFTATSYYLTIITLAAGGLNPFILGVLAGVGLTIGDSIFFYFGMKGRHLFEKLFFEQKLGKFSEWLHKKPSYFILIIAYVYTAFMPFPTDILMLFFALGNYSFKRILPFILLGNITQITLVAYLAGISFL